MELNAPPEHASSTPQAKLALSQSDPRQSRTIKKYLVRSVSRAATIARAGVQDSKIT
jgi:hypothetical protein